MEDQKEKDLGSVALQTSGLQPPVSSAASGVPVDGIAPKGHTPSFPWLQVGLVCFGLAILITGWALAGYLFAAARVGGNMVSLRQSDSRLATNLQQITSRYKLAITYPDGATKQYGYSQMGFGADTTATVAALRTEQHSLLQKLQWWQPVQKQVVLTVDTHLLHDFIAQHITVTVQPAKDATIAIVNGEVQLSDASAGKEYGLRNPQVTLANLAGSLQRTPIVLKTLTLTPALTTEQLSGSKTQLEHVLSQPVTFTIGSKKVTASKTDIAAWLELTPDEKAKKVDVDINSGKVLEYINKIAAASVHPPRDQVEISRDDGTKSVLVPGVNGIDVTAKQTIANEVTAKALAGKGVDVSLPVSFAAYKTVTAAAYPKWIEVDLTNKQMYAYETTNVVKTFQVTAGAPATPTVTGQYAIYAKYVQQDMRGYNADGSKYFQPNVPWINYFYKDYAIHGNYWRPLSYFGNVNSSHGCVSVIPSEAEWVYDWAPIGTPVIIHT